MLNQIILGYCVLTVFSIGLGKFCEWYSDGGIINPYNKSDLDLLMTEEQKTWPEEKLRMFYAVWFLVVPLITAYRLPTILMDLYHTYKAKVFIKEFRKKLDALDEMERRFLEKYNAAVKMREEELSKQNDEASK